MSVIFKHIDWLGVLLSLFGWFLMARQRFIALLVLIFANVIWFTWGFTTNVPSIMFLQVSFMLLNFRTIYEWLKTEAKKPDEFRYKCYKFLKGMWER